MSFTRCLLAACLGSWLFCSLLNAQQPVFSPSSTVVPRLVNFSGKATDPQGKVISGIAGVTFAIYKDQFEGAPLWLETQNVQADAKGNYTVQLGATKSDGLPLELFSSGEARWLGVRVNGGEEQPRVLLLSVPYALKAADAETVGGLPASAFMLAAPVAIGSAPESSTAATVPPPAATDVTTTGGTINYLPIFNGAATIIDSAVFQTGSGTTAKVGINTITPATRLDVNGAGTIRGTLSLPATAVATAAAGKISQPLTLVASSFDKTSSTALNQTFQLQAEPAANDTAAPSGTLNLLYGLGATNPVETGLKIGGKGILTFAPGQTFPGTGPGSVKSVGLSAPATDFTVSGSPVTGSGTLGLKWKVAPTNADTANAIVKRDANGSFNALGINADHITLTSMFNNPVNSVATCNCEAVAGTSLGQGVFGESTGVATPGEIIAGVRGIDEQLSTSTAGVIGESWSSTGLGVIGRNSNGFGTLAQTIAGTEQVGILGDSNGIAVAAISDDGQALLAENNSGADTAVIVNNGTGFPLFVSGPGGSVLVDGNGNLTASGGITGASKNFRIDHPLDPADKYLNHTSIESSEMLNLYTGNVTTDSQGEATVQLPEWFEVLNTDFRYQLTVIGQFAQAIIGRKIENNRFEIRTSAPNVEVSWQVTGVRQDAYAKANPLVVEQEKEAGLRGYYIHPEFYGAPPEKQIEWARHPQMMKRIKEMQAKQLAAAQKQAVPRN